MRCVILFLLTGKKQFRTGSERLISALNLLLGSVTTHHFGRNLLGAMVINESISLGGAIIERAENVF